MKGIKIPIGANLRPLKAGMAKVGPEIASGFRKVGVMAGAALASGFATAAAGAFKGVKLAAELETMTTSFEVLTGSADTARQVIADMNRLSESTPLSPDEVIAAGRALLAFNGSAETVTAELGMLGDVATGIGQPLGEIAEIYGKARVQGRLFGEDINQLTGRGIPIITELAKVLGVAEGEIKGLVSQGRVGFPELQQAFQNMTGEGGKFENMMQRQSQTLAGMLSTLKGKLDAALRDAMTQFLPEIKGVVDQLISYLETATNLARSGNLGEALRLSFVAAMKNAANALINGALSAAGMFVGTIGGGVLEAFSRARDLIMIGMRSVQAMLLHAAAEIMNGAAKTAAALNLPGAQAMARSSMHLGIASSRAHAAANAESAAFRSRGGFMDAALNEGRRMARDLVDLLGDPFSSAAEKDRLAALLRQAMEGVAAGKGGGGRGQLPALAPTAGPATATEQKKAMAKALGISAGDFARSSLTEAGGTRGRLFTATLTDISRESRDHLATIAENTRNLSQGVTATYA